MESMCSASETVTKYEELVGCVSELLGFVGGLQELRAAGEELPPFEQVERELLARISEGARLSTAAALEAYKASAPVVDVGGRLYARMPQASSGTYFTMHGAVEVERHLYREVGVRNGATVVPLELRAGLFEGRWTPRAAAAAAHLIQSVPSREAEALCGSLQVLPLSRSSLARVADAVGRDWETRRERAEAHLLDAWELPERARAISVSVDRVNVPVSVVSDVYLDPETKRTRRRLQVEYRQAYCAVITAYDHDGAPVGCIRYGRMPSYGRDALEQTLRADLLALLSLRPDLKVVGLADGAPEMQKLLDRVFQAVALPADTPVVLDFWHVIEKLAVAVVATGRSADQHLPTWKAELVANDYAIFRILTRLRTWRTHYLDSAMIPEALDDAITYLDNNAERMRYASLRADKLPIGSGTVEATCKTLVTVRLKRPGARWSESGAQAILHLRGLATSNRWEAGMGFLMSQHVHQVIPVRLAA